MSPNNATPESKKRDLKWAIMSGGALGLVRFVIGAVVVAVVVEPSRNEASMQGVADAAWQATIAAGIGAWLTGTLGWSWRCPCGANKVRGLAIGLAAAMGSYLAVTIFGCVHFFIMWASQQGEGLADVGLVMVMGWGCGVASFVYTSLFVLPGMAATGFLLKHWQEKSGRQTP